MEIITGSLLILLGIAAFSLPIATSAAVVIVVSWTLLGAGFVHLFAMTRARSFGDGLVAALVGIAYVVTSVLVVTHPIWGLATVTLFISAALLFEGTATVAAYFLLAGPAGRPYWLLVSGALTLLLAVIVFSIGTATPALLISTVVGVNFVASGMSRIFASFAGHTFRRERHA